MEDSKILSLPQFKRVAIIAGLFSLVYLVICLFVIGGDDFVLAFINFSTIPLAIATTLFALSLWNMVKTSSISRTLSINLFIAWLLWTIAEILWAFYDSQGQEVPYPSPADIFWLIGYLPIWIALYLRIYELPVRLKQNQKTIYGAVSLVTVLLVFIFVLVPIIENNDPSRWLENTLNIIYPLADLATLLFALRIAMVYRGGDYGLSWNLIIAGFIVNTASNLLFSYANSFDLYYPENKVDMLSSILIDAPYNFSYVLWLLGFYALRLTMSRQRPVETFVKPDLIPNTHILIFTKNDNTVIQTSNNFWGIFEAENVEGKRSTELLQIPEEEARFIHDKIQQEGKIADYPIRVKDRTGVEREAFISGIAITSSRKDYSGCILMLRLLVETDYSLDNSLTQYQKLMVRHLQQTSGSREEAEIETLLFDYHLAYLAPLQNLVFQAGGTQLGMVFLENLKNQPDHQWQLQFNDQTLLSRADYPLDVLRKELPLLLETAKKLAAQLTDPQLVEAEMQTITAQIDNLVHQNVAYLLQPEPETTAPAKG